MAFHNAVAEQKEKTSNVRHNRIGLENAGAEYMGAVSALVVICESRKPEPQ